VRCELKLECKLPVETDVETPAEGPAETRVARAVSGVGGPIIFLDVSGGFVEDVSLLIFETVEEDEPSRLRDAVLGPLMGALILLRPPVMNGCLMALCGFRRRSGSQTRHFAMKSTNSASSHLNT
jgi:hypothetical protein